MTTRVNIKNIVIALAIGLVMVSCGGRGGNQQGGAATTETQTEQATPDTKTVSGFLSQIGLTETDVKPEGAGEGIVIDVSSSGNRASISWNMVDVTAEKENAWLKKVYDKTKALSTGGKVYVDGTDLKQEFVFAPLNRAEYQSDMHWVLPYNGKEIGIRCQILGNGAVDISIIII